MSQQNLSRRHFLRGEFLGTLTPEHKKLQQTNYLRPPWAVANAAFIEGCSRCGDCIAVCETQILVRGEGDFPEIRFSQGECTFCQKCVQVCQAPIFRAVSEAPFNHKVKIGASCLTHNHIECRVCQDNCPTRAIKFVWQAGGIAQPQINLEACNGCGGCIKPCPMNAISLDFNIQHNETI